MLNRIEAVQWNAFAQPEWNKPHSVPDALAKLMAATDVESCSSACDKLLYSVGNDHAGTYYPVLLAVLPFLEEAVMQGAHWPQRAALSVLDDLYASFHPEPGYEQAVLPGVGAQEIESRFRHRVKALSSALAQIASNNTPNAEIAGDLLGLLSEDA